MKQIRYTSIDRIFSKLIRDFGMEGINESDVVEWCGEALEAIGAVSLYEETVAFIEVSNHQCDLPTGLHSIIQVAKYNNWRGSSKEKREGLLCPKNIVDNLIPEEQIERKVDIPVCLDCEGKPLNDYDVAYYRPYFDLQYFYASWCSSKSYRQFSPIRLANHTFFNSIVCEEKNSEINSLYRNSTDEYTIIKGEVLRFSFKEGYIALAYHRQVTDTETGYPLIPDHYSYVTAITKYVTMKILEKLFYAGREGASQKLQKAEADWHWYCGQAANHAMMPKGIDQWQNIMEERQYILPRTKRYYNYFGNMSRIENRGWNNTDLRNNNL